MDHLLHIPIVAYTNLALWCGEPIDMYTTIIRSVAVMAGCNGKVLERLREVTDIWLCDITLH